MQRLTRLLRSQDAGATGVLVALMLVVLVGFGAIAVDIGSLWSDRKQLQNGADAGALAIAQSCAQTPALPDCVLGANPTAESMADANELDGVSVGVVTSLVTTGPSRHVTVRTTSTRQHWLAPVIGIDASEVGAEATASWGGSPSSMTTIPIAISTCQFLWQNGVASGMPTPGSPVEIFLKSKAKDFPTDGTFDCMDGAAHNEVGGGFGWLTTTGDCSTLTSEGGWVANDPGNSMPGSCSEAELQAIFGTAPGEIVHVPLFDETNGDNGPNAKYKITGYAALEISGYCFQPSPKMNPGSPCNGDSQHIRATFVGHHTLDDITGGGTDYGLVAVKLTD